jgi:pre-rRNA-processing protein TSR3
VRDKGLPLPDVVLRHPRERLSKCSLEPLRGRPDLRFLKATPAFSFDATGFILLAIDAPVLGPEDRHLPLLLLDSTWRLLPSLLQKVEGWPLRRSLPAGVRTAYPRRNQEGRDPARGLASVEALYLARRLQGRPCHDLLDHYYWREAFLSSLDKLALPQTAPGQAD